MLWATLNQENTFVCEDDEDVLDGSTNDFRKFKIRRDVDSLIVVAVHLENFNTCGGGGFTNVNLNSSLPVKFCENKKMLSLLSRSFVTRGSGPRRFLEFVLSGTGHDRIFVLFELSSSSMRSADPDFFETVRESYIRDVVITALKDLPADGLTRSTFGKQSGHATTKDKCFVHKRDWPIFAVNVKVNEADWIATNGHVVRTFFYVATHGRRFSIAEAREFLERLCDDERARSSQVLCQVHYAETLVPPKDSASVIDFRSLKTQFGSLNLVTDSLQYARPYGIRNAGFFRGVIDVKSGDFDPLPEEEETTAARGDGLPYERFNPSFIQIYDPLIHVFQRDLSRTRDPVVSHAFLLNLLSEKAKTTRYIEKVENLKNRATRVLENFREFIESSETIGNGMRLEVVLNFKSTADETLSFFFKRLLSVPNGSLPLPPHAGDKNFPNEKDSLLVKPFCRKNLIIVCVDGWRDWIASTGGLFFESLISEISNKKSHPNSVDYFGGVRYFEELPEELNYDEDDDVVVVEQEGGNERGRTGNGSSSRLLVGDDKTKHVVFAECFQFVYDCELRLSQWIHGDTRNLDSRRFYIQCDGNASLSCHLRREPTNDRPSREFAERPAAAAAVTRESSPSASLELLNYLPLKRVARLKKIPDKILENEFILRAVSNWIWSTLPGAEKRYELRVMTHRERCLNEVLRLVLCHGFRFSSMSGLNFPLTAETAFSASRIMNPCHSKTSKVRLSGSVAPEDVANWMLGRSRFDDSLSVASGRRSSIKEILRDAVVSDSTDPVFELTLLQFIRDNLEVFPDVRVMNERDDGLHCDFWVFVGSNDENRIWKDALLIMKDQLKISPTCLKKLPSDVNECWLISLIDLLLSKCGDRYRDSVNAMVALVVAINLLEDLPTKLTKIDHLKWNNFVKNSKIPIYLLKNLGLIRNGTVYENLGGVPEFRNFLERRFSAAGGSDSSFAPEPLFEKYTLG